MVITELLAKGETDLYTLNKALFLEMISTWKHCRELKAEAHIHKGGTVHSGLVSNIRRAQTWKWLFSC